MDAKPHYTAPSAQSSHVALCYRNFMAQSNCFSHIGLGINCLHTCKVLRANHVRCDVFPVWTYEDVIKVINKNPTITHMVIEAPFLANGKLTQIVNENSNINFTCRCHSQIAFLQVEPGAVNLIRDYIRLQDTSLNFKLSVNSDRMGSFLEQVYGARILWLPNLYYTDIVKSRVWHPPAKTIKLGSFGAIRLMKNHVTSAAAALMIASIHKKDLIFYLSVDREEHGKGVLMSIRNMFSSVPFAKLDEVPWANWSDFRNIIANLDLHMQLSMSETFNITSADAAAGGVPTVCSEAIDWVPDRWYADPDNAADVARKGWDLMSDPNAGNDGLSHLRQFNDMSVGKWLAWLNGEIKTMKDYYLH